VPKDLFLIRHAKSSWKEAGLSDHERPLNKRGNHDAPLMAKIIQDSGVSPDLLVSSTAVRAKKTAEAFAEVFGIKRNEILLSEDLYMADENDIIKRLQSVKDEIETVFLFAHNPGITDFANALCSTDIPNIPTCGVFHSRIPSLSWKDTEFGKGKFITFDFPKKHYHGKHAE
jgi:phosphohistidine phosphatase